MRFPVSITYPQNGETIEIKDHKMVFQLAATLNEINGYDPALSVDFIEWIQNSANAPVDTDKRRPDGTVPGNAEVAANSSLAPTPAQVDNATAVTADGDAIVQWQTLNVTNITEMANNIFRAHKKAIDAGYLSWSEAAYLRYHLNATLNVTDEIDDLWDAYDNWLYDNEYFSATKWRTIDKGLSRLPAAFAPLVSNKTLFNSVVNELSWNEATQKITVFYKPRNASWAKSSSIEFDYVVTAVPFTKVRLWRMPAYSSLLSRAINRYSYDPACKVAILYETRFWEHLEYPIIGGCGAVNVTPIGEICYPSYKINSTGPGVLLASYIEIDAFTQSLQALSDSDHVALVQRAMVDVHGEVANEQFTGIYDRVCWGTMPDQAGAWLGPVSGQQQLYLPAFFNTEMHTIFVGEHTSYVHAWIWSALESAVRGTTQLLLEMGLVDEANQITETWMARWLTL
jgi:monoamine oxidase